MKSNSRQISPFRIGLLRWTLWAGTICLGQFVLDHFGCVLWKGPFDSIFCVWPFELHSFNDNSFHTLATIDNHWQPIAILLQSYCTQSWARADKYTIHTVTSFSWVFRDGKRSWRLWHWHYYFFFTIVLILVLVFVVCAIFVIFACFCTMFSVFRGLHSFGRPLQRSPSFVC